MFVWAFSPVTAGQKSVNHLLVWTLKIQNCPSKPPKTVLV